MKSNTKTTAIAGICLIVIFSSTFAFGQLTPRERQRRGGGILPPTATVPGNVQAQPRVTVTPQATGINNPSQPAASPAANTSVVTNPTNLRGPIPQSPFAGPRTEQQTLLVPPAPAAGYGTGGRYAAAGVSVTNPAVPQNPFASSQPRYQPPQAASIGQPIKPATNMKPFDNLTPQSPYSPYMYMYAGRRGGMDNYNLYVRPAQQQQAYDQRMQREVQTLQQNLQQAQNQLNNQNRQIQQWSESNAQNQGFQSLPDSPVNPYNNGSPYFMNQYQQYFNTIGNQR